jgi:hypothetical protein
VNANSTYADRTREVLSFFLRHPGTSDSVEGIARWRLLEQRLLRSVEETESILDDLVALGFLEEITAPGIPRLFRLRQEKAEEAAAFIGQRTKSGLH